MRWKHELQVNGKYGIYTKDGEKIANQINIGSAMRIVAAHNKEQPPMSKPPIKEPK